MPRRRSIYSIPRLRLRQKTVITVGSIVALILAGLSLVSFFTDSYLSFWRELLQQNLGWLSFLSPVVFFLTSLVLQRVKWPFTQMNVLLGLLTIIVSLMGLSTLVKQDLGGSIGTSVWEELASFITVPGAIILLSGVFFVGVVVLLNTSFEDVGDILTKMFKSAIAVLGIFKKVYDFVFNRADRFALRSTPEMKVTGIDEKPKIKPLSKDSRDLSPETVISNVAGQTKVWRYPPYNLLTDRAGAPADRGDVKKNANIIEKTLESFGIQARVAEVNGGPAVTQYALEIAAGTKILKIANLQHDIALALATRTGTVRIEAPIPGKSLVGIEVPNQTLEIVTLKSVISSDVMKKNKSNLAVCLGKDTGSNPVVFEIDKMPHVLVAGTTGSGKSVLIHSLVTTLLFRNSPDELKLILIDPKRVELTNYNGIPHLLTPVIVEPEKVLSALKWTMAEMERRYKLFQSVGVRNIAGYNEMSGFQALPYIVILVDELADLMMFAPVEFEDAITRLAQLARATGIHLVVATQRPSVDVITGLMKANIPCRIAFNVSSMVDSRVIIDQPGAEKLLGRGDMLFLPPDASKPVRIQGVMVTDQEINVVVKQLKSSGFEPQYAEEVTAMPIGRIGRGWGQGVGSDEKDELFEEAVRTVCQYDRASASLLQRRLRVGYARAARIIDELESAGIVGPGEGSKPRDVLIRNADDYFTARASVAPKAAE